MEAELCDEVAASVVIIAVCAVGVVLVGWGLGAAFRAADWWDSGGFRKLFCRVPKPDPRELEQKIAGLANKLAFGRWNGERWTRVEYDHCTVVDQLDSRISAIEARHCREDRKAQYEAIIKKYGSAAKAAERSAKLERQRRDAGLDHGEIGEYENLRAAGFGIREG